jgi:hypothetical protein
MRVRDPEEVNAAHRGADGREGSGRGSVRPFGVNRDTGATVVLAEHGQGWYDER